MARANSTDSELSKISKSVSSAEYEIRAVIDGVKRAVDSADLDGILAFYDDDARLFDVRDSLQHRDLNSFREYWEECFRSAKKFSYDLHDLQIVVDGDLALCTMFSNCHITGQDDRDFETWLRVTDCLRRRSGKWRVIHEHVSVPGDFVHGRLLDNLKPGEEVNREQRGVSKQ